MLLLFDLDGTLIDSAPGIIACIEHACTAMSVAAPPRAVLRGWIGPPLGETFPGVVGSDPGRVDAAIAHYRERFDRIGWREHRVHAGMDAVIAAQPDTRWPSSPPRCRPKPSALSPRCPSATPLPAFMAPQPTLGIARRHR